MKLVFVITLLVFSQFAYPYAHFIGHGYTSCMNCHFNPMGGGQLNDYGRAVSATGISSRVLYPESMSEEQIANISGFLFKKNKQTWFRPQVNYRGFEIRQNPGGSAETKQWMTMQADVRATLKFGDNDRFIISGDYGKTPYPQNRVAGKDYDRYRSRSHYLGFRVVPKFGLYAGLMDKVYGLRIIEHTAFSRTATQTTQNDQVHGVVGHYLDEGWEAGVQAFVGNLSQEEPLRMKGVSGTLERTIFEQHRLGVSFQSAKNEYFELQSYSLLGKFSFKEGSAVLAEVGEATRTTSNGSDDRTSRFALLQTSLRPWRGFYVLNNIEYLKNDTKLENYTVRWGPALQFFPLQRLELRVDLYNTRNFIPDSATADSWTLISQIHVWL